VMKDRNDFPSSCNKVKGCFFAKKGFTGFARGLENLEMKK